MVLTKACAYGVFGVMYLAKQPRGKIVSLSEVARSENIPEKFLAKIFQGLTRSGLIRSHRGARGGFSLARPANQITVKELLEAIQGPFALAKCLSEQEDCDKEEMCKLRKILQKAQDSTMRVLNQHNLVDITF